MAHMNKVIRDGSEKKYWFKPKRFGYGLTPISWEGWLATLIFVVILLLSGYVNNIFSETEAIHDILRFILDIIILASLFLLIFKDKTQGELKWYWG